jgi:hypothetical protein
MRHTFRALAFVLAVSAGMTAASVVPSFAQTTTDATVPVVKKPVRRHHILHPGIASAPARNVGPTSSTAGAGAGTEGAGASKSSGLSSVPGAPGAGSSGTGGK